MRYLTAGSSELGGSAAVLRQLALTGITLAHNGNLTNVEQLAKEIYEFDLRHVNTNSDSEVLLNVFAHELAVAQQAAAHRGGHLRRGFLRARPLRRRLRGGGDDHRPWHRRLPRPQCDPSDRLRPAACREWRRIHDRLRGAWPWTYSASP
ncbi:hypothetical protein AAHB60_13480 [Pseudomonas aeruginosa]